MQHGEITQVLARVRAGEPAAFDEVMPLVYDELRGLARRLLKRGGKNRPIATTSLVHEAYLKLGGRAEPDWEDRGQFFAVAAVAMRHLIVDAARRRAAQKRGGHLDEVEFDENRIRLDGYADEIVRLDAALAELAEVSERLTRVVELRFFAGLSIEEVAQTLGVTPRTVNRDWRKARAFLRVLLDAGGRAA